MNKDTSQSELEGPPSTTEAMTKAYLAEHGVALLPLADYKTGQTVLYVMEQFTQADDGPFGKLPPNERPSVARMDHPGELDLSNPYKPDPRDKDQKRIVYDLSNNGDRVDYYAINAESGEVVWVKASFTKTDMSANPPVHPYKIRPENLFKAKDDLFPKGGGDKKTGGYGLIILLIVVAIMALLAVRIIGKSDSSAYEAGDTQAEQKRESEEATTPSGIIQTKQKANTAASAENQYNQELQNAVNE